ncbi:EF-hand domain-containing family member B [Liparis tanakae]|uniref:EF-hand domain-containing family member B n=1 Tax=Liparis tanakae TaxID=230148 RepID=A0A4Z2F3H4_9TELE|nr:EF-hand domain-containing family member B [Liparis tanakae]
MAMNISLTFMEVLADVSMKSKLLSSAYDCSAAPGAPTHLICDVVHHDGRLGASVVHGRQAVVALLTGRVPDLKLDRRVVQTHRLSQEGGCGSTKRRSACLQEGRKVRFCERPGNGFLQGTGLQAASKKLQGQGLTPPQVRRFRNRVHPNPGATRVPNGGANDPDVASTLVHGNSTQDGDTVKSLLSPNKPTLFQEKLQDLRGAGGKAVGGSRDQHVGHPTNNETTYGLKTVKGERIDRKYGRSHFSQDGCFGVATPHAEDGSAVGKTLRWLGETLKFCNPNPAWKRAGTKEMLAAQIGQTTKVGGNTFHLPPDHTFGKVVPQDEFGVGALIHSTPPGQDARRRLVNAAGTGRIPKEDLHAVCRQFQLDVSTPVLDDLMEPDRDGLVDIREFVDLLNWKDEKPDGGRDQSPTTTRQRVDDTNDYGDRSTVAALLRPSLHGLQGDDPPFDCARSKEEILRIYRAVYADVPEETLEEAWSLAAAEHPDGEMSLKVFYDALKEIKAI